VTVFIFGALFGLATLPVPGATGYLWTLTYTDGVVEAYTSTESVIDNLPPRDGRCFTAVVCAQQAGACSPLSALYCTNPIPGDADLDGIVGAPDFSIFGIHFGEHAP
jgi:hypothetical protein